MASTRTPVLQGGEHVSAPLLVNADELDIAIRHADGLHRLSTHYQAQKEIIR